ncbi:hypothetical protein Ddc_24409 [Ditylenchus destructor]|nr:hypothetical protein Ddc_24409 [Ditylenchus destructor]
MRKSARLGKKQTNSEYEAQMKSKAKTSQSDNKMPNIAAIDNGTMVESLKFLNYCQLATSSLVSKKYWNLIRSHRHLLALLDVAEISMNSSAASQDPADIQMFNEELSPGKYNEWVVHNGYSKLIPFDDKIAGKECTGNSRNIYELYAAVYRRLNPHYCYKISTTVLYADVGFNDENWPIFQHFIRLLTDPFIYIRSLTLTSQKDVLSLLAGAMNPDRDRLQCKHLSIDFNGDNQKFIVWIKDHVHCDEFKISLDWNSNYDEELLDLFLTGASCASAIRVISYDPSKVIIALVQKFMDLKNREEYQLVESILGDVEDQKVVKALKRDCAKFIAEEEQFEEDHGTTQVIGFINNDIEKKLTLNVKKFFYSSSTFSIEISNL